MQLQPADLCPGETLETSIFLPGHHKGGEVCILRLSCPETGKLELAVPWSILKSLSHLRGTSKGSAFSNTFSSSSTAPEGRLLGQKMCQAPLTNVLRHADSALHFMSLILEWLPPFGWVNVSCYHIQPFASSL